MRKIIAIFLLSSHLFNICGYRLLFTLLDNAANEQMISSLDNNSYSESDLYQIKLALHTPYIQGGTHYERCDGEIEYNGIQYNYVKRLVQNDTLYLYCIPNHKKTEIDKSRNEFANQNASCPSDTKPGRDVVKQGNFSSEFRLGFFSFGFDFQEKLSTPSSVINNLAVNDGFLTRHIQPPDLSI